MLNIDHIAIVVHDLEEALCVYRDALGLTVDHIQDVPAEQVQVAFLPLPQSQSKIELVQPATDESGIARYLQKRGEGIHHICLQVENIEQALARLSTHGLQATESQIQQREDGQKYIFIHPKTTHGVLIELYEKQTREVMDLDASERQGKRSLTDMELTHQQAVKYGQDMAEIYKQERAKREALEVAYKKLEGALESMSDGYLVVDQSLDIVEINQACADLFELTPESAVGESLSKLLFGSEDADVLCNRLQDGERAKLVQHINMIMPVERNLHVHAAPLPDGGWVLVLHDITWEERVNNMREEFLNLAAHELRTPLAGILGFASLLEQSTGKDKLGDDAWLYLTKVLQSAERLRDTVDDLLDFTVGNNQEIQVQAVDLKTIVYDTIMLLNKQASEHNVSLKLELPDEPMTVFGEKKMLSVAIGHLVENGIRYNQPNGSLTISSQTEEDNHKLIFTDTGVGMTRKKLEYAFRPFFQAEEHTTRRAVGMGLGLSIVQRTLALHQGEVSATSEPNVGSVFTITLPRFKAENMEQAKSEWLKIQKNLRDRAQKPSVDEQTQNLIKTLKTQLQITQSQSLAYAEDLAKLYQTQRNEAKTEKANQSKITHTDRLAMMGQLAAGVAHDLSNLIGPILGYSQVILRKRDAIDPDLVDIIERILGTSRRANILLRQMVNLSSIHANKREWMQLNDLVREILPLLEIKIKQSEIILKEAYDSSLPSIMGNPIQISQVVLNIIVNAIDAMETGGQLTIMTSIQEAGGELFAQLQITDSGSGISPEVLPHIFDAFFTTKPEGSGTGLGLSISKDIIENHNGHLNVDSTLNVGTTFLIQLPIQKEILEGHDAARI